MRLTVAPRKKSIFQNCERFFSSILEIGRRIEKTCRFYALLSDLTKRVFFHLPKNEQG